MKKLENLKYTIQRSKGLGENQPEMMWETTMNPETRRLIKVMPDDVEKTKEVFELLLGDNLAGRKEHIAENGYKYIDMTDLMKFLKGTEQKWQEKLQKSLLKSQRKRLNP